MIDDTFEPGRGAGATYGMGLYCVYDLKGSPTAAGGYGRHVLKLKVNLHEYIIFDPDIAAKVYGSSLTPAEQAEEIGLRRDIVGKLRDLQQMKIAVSSDIARPAADFLRGNCKGIVFTGRQDGRVVVVYDPTTVVPVGWTTASRDLADNPSIATWTPIEKGLRKSAIVRSSSGAWEEGKYEHDSLVLLKKLRRLPPKMRVVKGDLDLDQAEIDSLPEGLRVMGSLGLRNNPIASLPNGLTVGGSLDISYCSNLTELPSDLTVGGWLHIDGTPIMSLPESLQVGKIIAIFHGDKSSIPDHLRGKVF